MSRSLWWALPALLLTALPARAVEPLWGEIPTVLGRGVLHPGLKIRYLDAGELRRSGMRMRMLEQELMLEYAPSASLNLRLDIPYYHNQHEGRGGGFKHRSFVSGLGDITLRAKHRFSSRQREGSVVQHAVLYGVKLPTGESEHRWSGFGFGGHAGHGSFRERLDPIDQTGTGKPGVLLGYAWSQENLRQSAWASVLWKRDVGGGFRLGDTVEVTGTVAPWLKRPNEAEELGLKLSAGLHGQYHGSDGLENGRSARNRYHVVGIHVAPILTRGNQIFQVGIFVPVVRSGMQHRVDYPYELRAAFEAYF